MLALVADASGPAASQFLGFRLDLDPSRVRQIQARLAKAGLTSSRLGPDGGILLTRDAAEITLADVYQAMARRSRRRKPANAFQRGLLEAVDQRTQAALATVTIADILRDARRAMHQARKARLKGGS